MSTKIYNAYKINSSSLDEVINFLFENKKEITSEIERYVIKDILLEMMVIYDKYCLEGEGKPYKEKIDETIDENESINRLILNKLWDKKNDEDKKEIETSIILYPKSIDYFGEKAYLFQYFGDNKFLPIIEKILDKKIMNYDYYNNTDHPDELTEFEWNLRKDHWKNIDVPLFNGMSITFTKENKYSIYYMNARKKELIQSIFDELKKEVTVNKRVENYTNEIMQSVAYEKCYKKFLKENNLENETKEKLRDIVFEKGMSIYFDSRDYVKKNLFTEDEIIIINQKSNQIKNLIKEDIVLEDFNEKIVDIKKKINVKFQKIKP